ncbi:MAG: hypothetical protein GYA40_02835 [Chloroflexi bacterium]|nr:hypothetical protein [Chloroflexota bacterium]
MDANEQANTGLPDPRLDQLTALVIQEICYSALAPAPNLAAASVGKSRRYILPFVLTPVQLMVWIY